MTESKGKQIREAWLPMFANPRLTDLDARIDAAIEERATAEYWRGWNERSVAADVDDAAIAAAEKHGYARGREEGIEDSAPDPELAAAERLTIYEVWLSVGRPDMKPRLSGSYEIRADAESNAQHFARLGTTAKVLAVSRPASAVRDLFDVPSVAGEVRA